MHYTLIFVLLSITFSDSYNMQLLSFLPYEQECSDITGFYQYGREFAVVGLQDAASFVDVTNPRAPFEVGRIDGNNNIWRDLKYWDRHVYIGTEANDGIKIVSVDDLDDPVLVNTIGMNYDENGDILDIDNSHNIHVDEDGYLYIVGANNHDIWIYDLNEDPSNPNLVGTWNLNGESTSQEGYCHDIEVYNDKLYCAAIYVGYFYIIDVADKSNPVTLASHFAGIDGISTHDVAVTEDEHYLFTGDENLGGHIKAWDISDYNNINLVDEYQTIDGAEHTSHNLYVKPGFNQLIISYYADGTRVLDISDPTNLEEIAYYDMSDVEGLYVGNWGTYIDLPSGNIISSDIEQGLFVLEIGGVSILHENVTDWDAEYSPYVPFVADVSTFDGFLTDVTLYYSYDNSNWLSANMYQANGNTYDAILTFDQFGVPIYYYIEASNSLNQTSVYPQDGSTVMFIYGDLLDVVNEEFETDSANSWYVESDASTGLWELAEPTPTYDDGVLAQTDFDHTENGELCFVTGNNESETSGQDDVDGGSTILYSPVFNLSSYEDALLTYWRWYTNNLGANPNTDYWNVQASNDGYSWIDLELTNESNPNWEKHRFVLSNYMELSSTMQFRFIASDLFNDTDTGSGGSLIEAALDDFLLEAISFESVSGDLNFDAEVNVLDVVLLVNFILDVEPSSEQFSVADINNDSALDVLDVVLLVNSILQ